MARQIDQHHLARARECRHDAVPRAHASAQPVHQKQRLTGTLSFEVQVHAHQRSATGMVPRRAVRLLPMPCPVRSLEEQQAAIDHVSTLTSHSTSHWRLHFVVQFELRICGRATNQRCATRKSSCQSHCGNRATHHLADAANGRFGDAATQLPNRRSVSGLGRQLQMAITTPKTPKHTDISASHAGT